MNPPKTNQAKSNRLILLLFSLLATAGTVVTPALVFLFPPALAPTQSDRKAEADRLLEQGNQQYQTSQYPAAIESWQKALAIYREIKDRNGEANTLVNAALSVL